MKKTPIFIMLLMVLGLGIACDRRNDNPVKEAQEEIGHEADEAGDKLEDAGDELQD